MSEIKTGGPAFPWCGDLNETPFINLGMTLRDYFAAKAMAAHYCDEGVMNRVAEEAEEQGIAEDDVIAARSYRLADAMITARKEQA
jgi:hypothetical protein